MGCSLHRSLASILLLALFCLAVSSCAPYRVYTLPEESYDRLDESQQERYRKSIRPCTVLTEQASDKDLAEHCRLSIIEFDDQGEFWRPKQLTDTLDLIEKSSDRQGREALVVVFVHGWKNDASLHNELEKNLGSFKQVLLQLTREEVNRAAELSRDEDDPLRPRSVIGVYMAWRGLSLRGKLLNQLSFFARKNAAVRVARVSFSHAIHRIVAKTKGTLSNTQGNPDSVAVVVGHSFGGLIVENTLLRTLTVETNDFAAYGADLTVLVNPANEAILARQSIHALAHAPPGDLQLEGVEVSRPLIVSVTSVDDSATGNVFPLGLWIKGLFKNFRRYDAEEPGLRRQKVYYTHTPGHLPPEADLSSHRMTCSGGVCQGDSTSSEEYLDAVEQERKVESKEGESKEEGSKEAGSTIFPPPKVKLGECFRAAEKRDDVRCIDRLSFVGAATDQTYSIQRMPHSFNRTAYWILRVPGSVVPDHSEIFQSELASLLAAFINLEHAHVENGEAGEEHPRPPNPGDADRHPGT